VNLSSSLVAPASNRVTLGLNLSILSNWSTRLTPKTYKPTTRNARIAAISLAFAGLAAIAAFSRPAVVSAATDPAPNTPAYYAEKVQPIFQENCYRCHGGLNHRGGLQIDTKAGLMKGGHDGAVLVPGHPEQSLLISLIRHEGPADDPMPMPPKGKISDADIATVTAWVKAGAIMPE
jgi:cytochrome c